MDLNWLNVLQRIITEYADEKANTHIENIQNLAQCLWCCVLEANAFPTSPLFPRPHDLSSFKPSIHPLPFNVVEI